MATAPDYLANPIFAAPGRALSLLSAPQPELPPPPPVPPVIAEIIVNLGLRFPASGTADIEARAERLKLLGQDCADIPAPLLERAARKWARENRFMPAAGELRALAREEQADDRSMTDFGKRQVEEHCDRLNAIGWCAGQWSVVRINDKWTVARNGS